MPHAKEILCRELYEALDCKKEVLFYSKRVATALRVWGQA